MKNANFFILAIAVLLSNAGPTFGNEVMPNGSYQYTLNINLPPGTGGMQPNLSLQYNSNGQNGIAGVGWALQGLPTISRINNGIGINFDGNDTFQGPGGKLVDIVGNRSVFHTEMESYAKYEPTFGNCSLPITDPCSWVMTDSNGLKFFFGSNANSRRTATGGSVAVWYIDKVMDLNGNYYTVEYEQDSGTVYPSRIIYTKNENSGMSKYRTVEFLYEKNRMDATPQFMSGVTFETKWRLSDIVVKTEVSQLFGLTIPLTGDQVRRYHLTYGYSVGTGRSRLITAQEYGADDQTSLPPVIFSWTESILTPGFDGPTTIFSTLQQHTSISGSATSLTSYLFTGDFNGDGKADIASSTSGSSPGSGWCIQFGDGYSFSAKQCMTGGLVVQTSISIYEPFSGITYTIPAPTTSNIFVGDFNGDGKTDLAKPTENFGGWCVMHGASSGFGPQLCMLGGLNLVTMPYRLYGITADLNQDGRGDILTTTGNGTWCVIHGNETNFNASQCMSGGIVLAPEKITTNAFFGDINGDGRIDIVASTGAGNWCVMHGNGVLFSPKQCISGGIVSPENITAYVFFADFDGDGKMDIADNGCVMHGNKTTFTAPQCSGSFVVPKFATNAIVGDFDGDKRADVLTSTGGTTWCLARGNDTAFAPQVCISNGIDISEVAPWVELPISVSSFFYPGDFNGDGRLDIAAMVDISGGWSIMSGSPSGIDRANVSRGVELIMPPSVRIENILFADFTGDGRLDVIARMVSGEGFSLARTLPWPNDFDLLTRITSIAGGQTEVLYQPAKKVIGAIVQDNLSYPVVPNKADRRLVTNITNKDGRGNSLTLSYKYYNGKVIFNPEAKDLGFEWIRESFPDGTYIQTTYRQDNPDLAGMSMRSEVYSSPIAGTARLLRRTETDYEVIPNVYSGTKLVRATQRRNWSYELDGSQIVFSRQLYSFDESQPYARGQILSTRIEHAFGSETGTVVQEYLNDPTNWVLGRLVRKKTTKAGNALSEERFVYDGQLNPLGTAPTCGAFKLCQKAVWLDKEWDASFSALQSTNRWILTQYAYDGYGNVIATTDALGRSTAIGYDTTYHTYPETLTNPLGQTRNRSYDARFGTVLSTTDSNDYRLNFTYDVFGRPLQAVEDSSGAVLSKNVYNTTGSATTQSVESCEADTSISGSSPGFRCSQKYFDGLGRTYRTVSEAGQDTSGQQLTSVDEVQFNAAGQICREFSPKIPELQATAGFTEYKYDAAGRVTKALYPENPGNNAAVACNNSTTASPGEVSTQSIFTGLAVSAVDANGNQQTTYKDALGRINRIENPMGATTTYTYDSAMRIATVTDAESRVSSIAYDSLGRQVSLIEPNTGQWKYAYDDAGNLAAQVDPKGKIIRLTYDAINRPTLKDLPDAETDIQYIYDNSDGTPAVANGIGRLTKIIDDSGNTVFSYDQRGNATSWIQTVEDKIFTFRAAYDVANRLTELTYPDGEKVRNYYSDVGNLYQVRLLKTGQSFGKPIITYSGPTLTQDGSRDRWEVKRKLGNGVESTVAVDILEMRVKTVKTSVACATPPCTIVQNQEYTHDKIGNITRITDNLDNTRSFDYTYDPLYRLTSATINGTTENFAYSLSGNLQQKATRTLSYGNSAHPHAVTSDSTGNSYAYDTNGNRTNLGARTVHYDSEDKLKEIKAGAVTKQRFKYDSSGIRIHKQREDGTVTYSLYGIYEVVKYPGGTSELHTKYIYGAEGDPAAQISRADVTLLTMQRAELETLAGFFSNKTFSGLLANLHHTSALLFAKYKPAQNISLLVVLTCIVAFLFYFLSHQSLRDQRALSASIQVSPFWHRFASVLLVCILVFEFSGCATNNDTVDPSPWGDLPTAIPGGTPQVGDAASDTGYGAYPIAGAFFIVPDHLGSVALLTDATGSVVTRYAYTPYGEIDNTRSNGADISRYGFTGQERDNETGLMYYQARYYDPQTGRFMTADSEFDSGAGSQGFNRYMYVGGNPVMNSDPSGHWLWVVGAVIGFFIGGTKGKNPFTFDYKREWDWGRAAAGAAIGAAVGYGLDKVIELTGGGAAGGSTQTTTTTYPVPKFDGITRDGWTMVTTTTTKAASASAGFAWTEAAVLIFFAAVVVTLWYIHTNSSHDPGYSYGGGYSPDSRQPYPHDPSTFTAQLVPPIPVPMPPPPFPMPAPTTSDAFYNHCSTCTPAVGNSGRNVRILLIELIKMRFGIGDSAAEDLNMYSKGGKQRVRDTELDELNDEQLGERLRTAKGKERLRIIKHLKGLKARNIQKRNGK